MSDQQEVIMQKIAEARLIDDFFFEAFADDKAACEEILRTILEDDQLTVINVAIQSRKRNVWRVRFLCTMGDGSKSNVVIQSGDNNDYFRRAWGNSDGVAVRDSMLGKRFDEILDLYMVHISENDFIGGGKTIYHVDKLLRETGGMINDGIHEVYVNTKIKDDSKISDLMECFTSKMVNDVKFPAITKRFRELKETEGGLATVGGILRELIKRERKEERMIIICNLILHEVSKEKLMEVFSREECAKAEAILREELDF